MITHKFVDLPNLDKVQAEVLSYLPEKYLYAPAFDVFTRDVFENHTHLKSAVSTIKPWDEVYAVVIITCHRDVGHPIHSDNIPYPQASYWVLNIPILNTEHSYTNFYEPLDNANPQWVAHGEASNATDYWPRYQPNEVRLIDKVYLHKPAFVNSGIPHAAHNDNPQQQRIILSIRFSTKHDWE